MSLTTSSTMISIGEPALDYRIPGGREATHSGWSFGRHIRKMRGLGAGLLLATLSTLLPSSAAAPADSVAKSCNEILANGGDQQELLLCQLSESSTLLAQLGILVSEGLDRLMQNQGIAAAEGTELDESGLEKRKHEYLRFGKRKHEYLRFGKRKHEYLRFGKRKHEYLRFGRK